MQVQDTDLPRTKRTTRPVLGRGLWKERAEMEKMKRCADNGTETRSGGRSAGGGPVAFWSVVDIQRSLRTAIRFTTDSRRNLTGFLFPHWEVDGVWILVG